MSNENISGDGEDSNSESISDSEYPEGMLFYDNIRYSSSEISYSIDSRCDDGKSMDAREAFNIIQDRTILRFNEMAEGRGEIFINCPPEGEKPSEGIDSRHYIAGEGGPSSVINTSEYYLIKNGSIILYTDNRCDRPIIAIHELLHALGFKHSSNKKSIMYAVSNCNQEITGDIIDKINVLYKDPSLADLKFIYGEGSKSGRYVNFNIEILNSGLRDSGDFILTLYINEKKTGTYDIGNLESGSGKILKVENLFFVGNPEKLEFRVDEDNMVNEINEENNKLSMVIG